MSSTISANTAKLGGGGIYHPAPTVNDSVTLNDSNISGNASSGNGGGIYNLGPLVLSGESSVTRNKASEHGGGIYNGGPATITEGVGWSGTVSLNEPDDIFP
jgi:predicted outer membrane repeat protein